jgi:ATP-dependent RNA helicase RhlE
VADNLAKNGYRVSSLQGNMTQNRRQSAIDGFRGGRYDILVATDIAARGIDVSEISHVINFDMPDTADSYTHRIGRTGRAQNTGEAFTFTAQTDEKIVRQIEKIMGTRIERRRLPGFDSAELNLAGKTGSGMERTSVPQRSGRDKKFKFSIADRKQRERAYL